MNIAGPPLIPGTPVPAPQPWYATLESKLVSEGKTFKAWLASDWKHIVYAIIGLIVVLKVL